MKIQELVSDVRSRVESASRPYQGALKAYMDTQRQAVGVMTRNSRTLAGTEIGAAKNVFAAAKTSFDKARTDGVRQVARNPQTYVPSGSAQIVSAYKDTIDVMVRTGNELSTVVSTGYKSMLDNLVSTPAQSSEKSTAPAEKATPAEPASGTASKSSTTAKTATTATESTAAKRKTASSGQTTGGQTTSGQTTSGQTTSGTAKRTQSNTTDDATTADNSSAS